MLIVGLEWEYLLEKGRRKLSEVMIHFTSQHDMGYIDVDSFQRQVNTNKFCVLHWANLYPKKKTATKLSLTKFSLIEYICIGEGIMIPFPLKGTINNVAWWMDGGMNRRTDMW